MVADKERFWPYVALGTVAGFVAWVFLFNIANDLFPDEDVQSAYGE